MIFSKKHLAVALLCFGALQAGEQPKKPQACTKNQATRSESWEMDSDVSFDRIITIDKQTMELVKNFDLQVIKQTTIPSILNLAACIGGYFFLSRHEKVKDSQIKKYLAAAGCSAIGLLLEKIILSTKLHSLKKLKGDRFEKLAKNLAKTLTESFSNHPLGTAEEVLDNEEWTAEKVHKLLTAPGSKPFPDEYLVAHSGVTSRVRFLKGIQNNIELILRQLDGSIPKISSKAQSHSKSGQAALFIKLLEIDDQTCYVRHRSSLLMFLTRAHRVVCQLRDHEIHLLEAVERAKNFGSKFDFLKK